MISGIGDGVWGRTGVGMDVESDGKEEGEEEGRRGVSASVGARMGVMGACERSFGGGGGGANVLSGFGGGVGGMGIEYGSSDSELLSNPLPPPGKGGSGGEGSGGGGGGGMTDIVNELAGEAGTALFRIALNARAKKPPTPPPPVLALAGGSIVDEGSDPSSAPGVNGAKTNSVISGFNFATPLPRPLPPTPLPPAPPEESFRRDEPGGPVVGKTFVSGSLV